jgi:hypothetical protein
MVERELPDAAYEINDLGVQAHYQFQDIHDRTVVITIHEKNPRKREPFGLLAPMGAAAEAPSSLPLVLLHDFYFSSYWLISSPGSVGCRCSLWKASQERSLCSY